MTRSLALTGAAGAVMVGLLVWLVLTLVGPERYPLEVVEGNLVLASLSEKGERAWFYIDTGARATVLDEVWAQGVGAALATDPNQALGIGWKSVALLRAGAVPRQPGVPWNLSCSLVIPSTPGGILALMTKRGIRAAGIIGADLLAGWSLDFRGDHPWLVRGSLGLSSGGDLVVEPLISDPGPSKAWRVPAVVEGAQPSPIGVLALVDSGAATALAWYWRSGTMERSGFRNPHSPLGTNGGAWSYISGLRFSLAGTPLEVPPVPSVAWTWDYDELNLGTPFLVSHRAVLDLASQTLAFDRRPRPTASTWFSPEAWAWRAHLEEGKGIRVDEVLPGSTLDRRGLKAGDLVTTIGAEPAAQPRSILEWQRAWRAFALTPP